MPCPHNEISIVQRSQRQSAVAAAAYQSGEKLFCEYDQQVKHYPEKRGIVHNEILLPANAPLEYADRNILWNAAEAVEKQWNSQLARRWVLTIPREIPPDQYAVLVREFCQQQFVSKGMIADFAIHDPHPPGHNPHAHVLLTMRAMDEHGKWLSKSRKVYDLDENGERIKLPSGRWKSHKEDTVDWNDQKYCEIWRHEWEVIQNRYLEANDRPERVDLRSYARQGLDIVPTVHEGAAVRQMEKRGIQTNIGNLNREIRAANRLMKSIRQLIQNLKGWITELGEKRKELLAQKAAEEATLLPNLLIIIFVIVYGRMIEIYCMVSLAPIPMATFGNHEQSHMGQNYLKCLFALGFQGFLILICVAIYAVLIQSVAISGDAINSIWSIVGYTVLLCFSLFKTSSVTKSVLGAH